MLSLSLLLACPPVVDTDKTEPAEPVDTGDTGDTGGNVDTSDTSDTGVPPRSNTRAVVTTVSDDYASGVMATVDLASWAVEDNVTTVPSDNGVVSHNGTVYLLGRFGYDYVRVYAKGKLSEPAAEFSVGDGANPIDVRECGGKVFVTRYGLDQMGVYDPSNWLLAGVVDLSGFADADGIPEMADLVDGPGNLYVAIQNLDQDNGWVPAGGAVAEIDCATMSVTQSWELSPNPSISAWPGRPDLLVTTGVYYNPDGSTALDGALSTLSVASGTVREIVSETELGENIVGISMVDESHGALLTTDDASRYSAWCINPDSGDRTLIFTTTSFIIDMEAGDGDNVWLAARQSWADPESAGGIITFDAVTCEPGSETWHKDTTFAPYSIAFF